MPVSHTKSARLAAVSEEHRCSTEGHEEGEAAMQAGAERFKRGSGGAPGPPVFTAASAAWS